MKTETTLIRIWNTCGKGLLVVAFSGLSILLALIGGADTPNAEETAFKEVAFTEEFLRNADNIATGKAIWDEQCKLCHGKTAYPGKAPRLKPHKYTPAFVYKRVTKGFRGMPPWGEVYNEHERMSVTAFVMSREFSN